MKLTREQLKDLIKGIVNEYSLHEPLPDKSKLPVSFGDEEDKPVNIPIKQKPISSMNPKIVPDKPIDEENSQQPIEYAVKVTLDHNHDGDQLTAEALIWDVAIDRAEINHIKLELERIVEKFIKDKNRTARKIR